MVDIATKTGRVFVDDTVELKMVVIYDLPKDQGFERAFEMFVQSWNEFKETNPNETPDILMLDFNKIAEPG